MQEKAKEPEIRFAGFTGAWEQRKVKDLAANTYGGGTPLTSNPEFWEGSIPWIQSSDLSEHNLFRVHPRKFISHAAVANSSVKIIPENSIAVITRVGVGKLAVMSFPYTTSQDFLSLSNLNTDVKFTSYQLYRRLQKDLNAVQGTSIKGITKEELLGKNIYIPGCQEQEAIGKFFSKIDSLLTLHQRKYEKLLNIKKSMLEKMFPKEGEVVPEIRFKGFTGAWEQRSLGEICVPVQRNDPYSHAPVMMITASSGFIYQSVRYSFDNSGQSLQKYTLLKKGELAYNHGASKLRPFGSCFALNVKEARIPFVYHSFAVNDDDPEFVSLELNGTNVEKQLRKLVSSGARMDGLLNISFDDYGTVTLPLPSIDEQKKISSFFLKLDSLLTLHQRKLEMLKNVKQAFLEKMFV